MTRRLPPRARRRLHQLGFALARFGYRYPDDRHPIVSALANATESATTVASWRAAADPRARRFGGAPVPVLFAVELGGCLRRRYPGAAGELDRPHVEVRPWPAEDPALAMLRSRRRP